jgi:ornithine decarboxylase
MAFQMGSDTGYDFKLLDVGGGFEDGNFEKTAKVLRDAIDRYFPSREDLRIIAEPGRFYVSKAFTLATNVIARRARAGVNDSGGELGGGMDFARGEHEDFGVSTTEGGDAFCRYGGDGDDVRMIEAVDVSDEIRSGKVSKNANATNPLLTPAPSNASLPEAEEEAQAQPSVMYYINDGVYGSFNCIMFDHQTVEPYVITIGHALVRSLPGSYHHTLGNTGGNINGGISDQVKPRQQNDESCMVSCSVWGPTCDSIDCVCPFTSLPRALEVGDWLGFENMGAYTICASSQFNGFRSSVVHYTSGVGASGMAVRRALARYSVVVGGI